MDYTTVSTNVTFFAGNTSQTFSVPITDDEVLEPSEQFEAVIKAVHYIEGVQPVPPVLLGPNISATGTIFDNDGELFACILLLKKVLNWFHCRFYCNV